jgi:hypothetical protein
MGDKGEERKANERFQMAAPNDILIIFFILLIVPTS